MKKLISILGIISITASTASVASCSTVNNKLTSIKNKVNNLTNVSSTVLRGVMIQNASQELNDGLPYDADYLYGLISSSKANDLMPGFKTDNQTTVGSLKNNYFGKQGFNRKDINNWDHPSNASYSDKEFLTDKVKSPNGPADSIGSMLTLVISAIKSNGGINPSISGLLEGVLGQLPLSESSIGSVSKDKMEGISSILSSASEPLAILIKALSKSNFAYGAISNLLNINFLNDLKEGKTSLLDGIMSTLSSINFLPLITGLLELLNYFDILTPLLDTLVNSILTMDNKQNMTNKQVMNATNKRLYNIFATLSGQNDKVITDKDELYKDVDYNFEKQFGEVMAGFFKNMSNINTSNIITIIPDILFVVAGILQRITSVDFETNVAQNNQDLFDNNSIKKNRNQDFLIKLGNESFNKHNFSTKILINNLRISLTSDENGYNLIKLFALLFESAGTNDGRIDLSYTESTAAWIARLIGSAFTLGLNYGGQEGLSPLLFAIGNGIAVFLKINVAGVGPNHVGNIFKALIDKIILNKDISGIQGLLETFGAKLPFTLSNESIKIMKNAWDALWSKDSTMLKDIIGGDKNISLQTILEGPVYKGKTISEIMELIYNAINSSSSNTQRYKKLKEESTGLAKGLQDISSALVYNKYKMYYGEGENKTEHNPLSYEEKDGYTALQVLMVASNAKGIYISIDGKENNKVKGSKAAMSALGTDFDENGKQINTAFRDNSLLLGLKNIIDDKSIDSLLDQIVKGFANVNNVKKDVSNKVYKTLIQSKNFKTKVKSYYGIDEGNVEAGITYVTTYTDPKTHKSFNYEVKLNLNIDSTDWKVTSIKRV
ncbi:Vmc-like lipoprotein signal peptide domain-containing protein [Spiroplasma sp. BIUS-1]|uniref:Vmc-like lipoprotein signal peptide domain-containing protein n=1 Tax=Spiroplasma sp. BIUS-1 TaxID=216964 RepID=UPI0013980E16|nr:hypothetical protein [Spiroplasma sp. BIUS-1]QHX36567.1 hypothetical protein SBIUS_v1c03140 [Spiroplasma sp. BIUS-1]